MIGPHQIYTCTLVFVYGFENKEQVSKTSRRCFILLVQIKSLEVRAILFSSLTKYL